jgi:hypothetical protein
MISVTVDVKNLGLDNFVTDPRQAGVYVQFVNSRTNVTTETEIGSIDRVTAGSVRVFRTVWTPMPFDLAGLGGTVRARIGYDPDINNDSVPCNNDLVFANDQLSISNDRVRAWLATTSNRLELNR